MPHEAGKLLVHNMNFVLVVAFIDQVFSDHGAPLVQYMQLIAFVQMKGAFVKRHISTWLAVLVD